MRDLPGALTQNKELLQQALQNPHPQEPHPLQDLPDLRRRSKRNAHHRLIRQNPQKTRQLDLRGGHQRRIHPHRCRRLRHDRIRRAEQLLLQDQLHPSLNGSPQGVPGPKAPGENSLLPTDETGQRPQRSPPQQMTMATYLIMKSNSY